MAKVFMLQWQLLPWLLWLSCCMFLLSTVVSDTDPARRPYRKNKNRSNAESRDRRVQNTNNKSYSSSLMTKMSYQDRLAHEKHQQKPKQKQKQQQHNLREQTTVLPEFLPDGPRVKMPDPSFMPEQEMVKVHRGDVAILPCTVQYLGARQISWQKLGTDHFLSIGTDIWVQDPNLRIKHFTWPAEVSNWNLEFRSARMEDSGVYECQLISTEKLTWSVELSVIEKPPHKPEISMEGKKFVESGQNVYLRCNTSEGDVIPDDIDWFKDGDKIEASRFPNIIITKFRYKETMTLVSELMISNGHSSDSGTYICRSTSSQIASIEVNILVGRKADSSNVKRGTGTSSTRIQPVSGDNNVGSSSTRWYFPYFSGHPVMLLISLLTPYLLT